MELEKVGVEDDGSSFVTALSITVDAIGMHKLRSKKEIRCKITAVARFVELHLLVVHESNESTTPLPRGNIGFLDWEVVVCHRHRVLTRDAAIYAGTQDLFPYLFGRLPAEFGSRSIWLGRRFPECRYSQAAGYAA